jgi:hypothetical protein
MHEFDGSGGSSGPREAILVVAVFIDACRRDGEAQPRPDPCATWKHGIAQGPADCWRARIVLGVRQGEFELAFYALLDTHPVASLICGATISCQS